MQGTFSPAIPLALLRVPLSDGSRAPAAKTPANESSLAKWQRAVREGGFILRSAGFCMGEDALGAWGQQSSQRYE